MGKPRRMHKPRSIPAALRITLYALRLGFGRREWDSNPRTSSVIRFQDGRIRPLCHLSTGNCTRTFGKRQDAKTPRQKEMSSQRECSAPRRKVHHVNYGSTAISAAGGTLVETWRLGVLAFLIWN